MTSNALDAIARSRATATRLAKTVTKTELRKAISNLQRALDNAEKHEAEKAAKERAANLKKLKSMIEEMGLSPNDIRGLTGATAKKRHSSPRKAVAKRKASGKRGPAKGTKVAPKYQLKVGKQLHKWTGRGRMPLTFREFVKNGGSLDKCLIKK